MQSKPILIAFIDFKAFKFGSIANRCNSKALFLHIR